MLVFYEILSVLRLMNDQCSRSVRLMDIKNCSKCKMTISVQDSNKDNEYSFRLSRAQANTLEK